MARNATEATNIPRAETVHQPKRDDRVPRGSADAAEAATGPSARTRARIAATDGGRTRPVEQLANTDIATLQIGSGERRPSPVSPVTHMCAPVPPARAKSRPGAKLHPSITSVKLRSRMATAAPDSASVSTT